MLAEYRHLRSFGHLPRFVRFDNFYVCERCLRPPSRPRRLAPVLQRRTLGA